MEARLQVEPAKAYAELGTWFSDHHQPACAVESFGRAVQMDPADLKSHLGLAAALDQTRHFSEAEQQWRAALALESQLPSAGEMQVKPALTGLTRNRISAKDYHAVIALLGEDNTHALARLTPELYDDLALAYGQSGMLEGAGDVLRKGLVAYPTSLPLADALAGVLVMQSRKQEAEDLLEATIKRNPGDIEVKLLYMRMLVMEDETTKAQALGGDLLAMSPDNWEVQYLYGLMERRAANYVDARIHLERAVSLNPDNTEAQHNLGSVLAKLKDAQGAKIHLLRAIELGENASPQAEDPQLRFELSMVLRSLGETTQADDQLKLYQQEAQTKSNLTQAAAKAAFADQKLAAGDTSEAIQLYRDALQTAPGLASIAYKLAMACDKAGDSVSERSLLEQALRLDPHMAEAQNQFAYLASRAGETASAEEHFRLAVQADPGFLTAWINLAATLLSESRFVDSQDAVSHALQLDPNNPKAIKLKQALDGIQSRP